MPASYRTFTYDARPPLRERLAASGLSLGIIAAVIVALLWVTAAPLVDMGSGDPLSTFDVASPPSALTVSPPSPEKAAPRPERDRSPPPPPPQTERTPPPPPVPVPTTPGMIVLSRDDFAASDIGGIRSRSTAKGSGEESAKADTGGGKPVYGPSMAPGGRSLYAADWYREPTRAEMAPFMPENQTEGWGMIACQTADRFRVENCRELGETPGSGIARGMRRASWQFLVRPPSVDGKPTIGAWVRIRFDLVRGIER